MSQVRARNSGGTAAAVNLSAGFILFALLGLSAVAWILTARTIDASMSMSLLPAFRSGADRAAMDGMSSAAMTAPLFIGMWTTMMAAMMFPSAAPMVLAYSKISKGRAQSPVAVVVFVAGYLAVWALVGSVFYAAYRVVNADTPSLSGNSLELIAGGALAASGIYQLTKLKARCLKHCRTPLHFLFDFKPKATGAARMGAEHGLFCVGCCIGLMVVLFVLGLMNLVWMGIVSAAIFIEKVAGAGARVATGLGLVLLCTGATLSTSAFWSVLVKG